MRFSKFEELRPGADEVPASTSAGKAPVQQVAESAPPLPGRRDFLKSAAGTAGAAAAVATGVGATQVAQAQTQTAQTTQVAQAAPAQAPFWPSRWGADDQAGASNWITPDKVKDAVKWIKDGKIYKIGRVYESTMPLFGARAFALRIPGAPTGGPFGDNKLIYNDEFLATEIGQVGTQFDGLGHIGVQMGKPGDTAEHRFYNGVTGAQMYDTYGLKKNGIEHCKPFFTRAHLVDVQGLTGQMWDKGQEIKPNHVLDALKKQKMDEKDIKPGDAVFFNTGWSSLWGKNNDRFNSGQPGIGVDVANWLVGKQISVTGADTWATEVVPNPNEKLAFHVHQILLTQNGIFNHENLNFEELLKDGKYRFVYVFSPMPIKGATGSAGSPTAMT
jgi:kynurenine formamidase